MNKTLQLKKTTMRLALGAGLVLATGLSTQAQTTIDFESINLSPETYWNGSEGFGGFVVDDAIFPNIYNTEWDYWESGFALSNITDDTQWGFDGQYIAQPFEGAYSSENYALGQSGSTLEFFTEQRLDSIYVSNNVYAASIIKDGDGWVAKQFGSTTNADGDDDGTNGEDWFMLRIIGYNEFGNKTDSVDFYLADYRFADDAQDTIIDTWQKIELSSLGNVKSVQFNLSSSDTGEFGMNTPSYFVLDNVSYSDAIQGHTVGLSENSTENIHLFPNPAVDVLTISNGRTGEQITIYNALGAVVLSESLLSETSRIDVSNLNKGLYLVEYLGQSQKLIIE